MSETSPPDPRPEEDFGIKILKDGTWLHEGQPIMRHNLAKLFATVLKRDENGDYWLETPAERGRIAVEDVPFVVVELRQETSEKGQNLLFRTNMDEWVTADAVHPLRMANAPEGGDLVPYIHIRQGLEARLNRAVYYELMALVEPAPAGETGFGVRSAGQFFPVG